MLIVYLILLELIMLKFPFRMIIVSLEKVLEYKMMIIVGYYLHASINSLICTIIMIHTIGIRYT